MKEISNRFALVQHEDIKETFLQDLKPYIPEVSPEFNCLSRVTFAQSVKEGQTRVWEQTFQAVTSDPRIAEYDGKRFVIGILLSDGSCILIGSPDQAPMLTVVPHGVSWEISARFLSSKKATW